MMILVAVSKIVYYVAIIANVTLLNALVTKYDAVRRLLLRQVLDTSEYFGEREHQSSLVVGDPLPNHQSK